MIRSIEIRSLFIILLIYKYSCMANLTITLYIYYYPEFLKSLIIYMNIQSAVCFLYICMRDFTRLNANCIRTPLPKITFSMNFYALH